MPNLSVLEAQDYYQALLDEIPKAKKRIVLAAMVILWGPRTAPIFIMLKDAISRGVKVTILLDTYTRLPYLYGATPRSSRQHRVRQTLRTLEDLAREGAMVHAFGKIGFPPYKGRCHIKVTIIDDDVYSFGGVNLLDHNLDTTDFMLHGKKDELADCLNQLVERIMGSRPPLPNGAVPLSEQSTVLFDGGQPKQSLIYDKACELTAHAKRVFFFSMMAPSGELAHLLNEIDSTLYFNRPEQMLPIDSLGQAYDQQKYRLTNAYKGREFIHGKFMLFELLGGQRAVLSGSHNFSYRGVGFGTQEVALHSTDPSLWDKLHAYLKQHTS